MGRITSAAMRGTGKGKGKDEVRIVDGFFLMIPLQGRVIHHEPTQNPMIMPFPVKAFGQKKKVGF